MPAAGFDGRPRRPGTFMPHGSLDELVLRPRGETLRSWWRGQPDQTLLGRRLSDWRAEGRGELGLPRDGTIIGTGHQTLLWHPGILAKYLFVDAIAAAHDLGRANLIVDQHAGGFGSFAVPVRRGDGTLAVRHLRLTAERPHVPMALHPAFAPTAPLDDWHPALPSVAAGTERIFEAVAAHRTAPNAARQMARALADLMRRWVRPAPEVTASDLLGTSLSRAILEKMVEDPWACAEQYNRAVADQAEAGVAPLQIGTGAVELPLWRVAENGQRIRAESGDLEACLEGTRTETLFPRALLLTAMVRLIVCDLFVHGTGGAGYDGAMERWIEGWLGVEPAPIAVASATMRLPLGRPDGEASSVADVVARFRRAWHDPESLDAGGASRPGPSKRELLRAIDAAPSGSAERRRRFAELHTRIEELRRQRREALRGKQELIERAARRVAEEPIVNARTWAFPLYEPAAIDELAAAVTRQVASAVPADPPPD